MSEKLIYADAFKKKFCARCNDILGDEPCLKSDCFFMALIDEAPAVDAVEVVQKEAVDYGYLADWYIRSVTNDPPVWTEEHIEELFNDFYLVPKDNGERRDDNENENEN